MRLRGFPPTPLLTREIRQENFFPSETVFLTTVIQYIGALKKIAESVDSFFPRNLDSSLNSRLIRTAFRG